MGDAVHWATTAPASLTATGWSGFPFPTPAGSDADHPVDLSVPDDCARWWWRIKNWKVTSTWTATFGSTVASFPNGTMDNSTNAGRELDLEQPSLLANHYFVKSNANSGVALSLFTILGAPAPCFKNGGVRSPAMALTSPSGPTLTRLFDGGFFVQFDFNPANLLAVTGSFTGVVDGQNVTIYYDATTSAPTSFSVGSMVFEADGYWPYAAADLSPIWDTVTGVQLQSERN